jgi:hypothetical protein
LAGRQRTDALANTVAATEGYGTRANEAILKAAGTLAELHKNMFPKEDPPKLLDELVEVFYVEPSPLEEYSHSQTVCGSQITLALAMAHGVPEEELKKATSGFPKKPNGIEVDLSPYVKSAKPLAKQLAWLVERKAAEKAAAKAR